MLGTQRKKGSYLLVLVDKNGRSIGKTKPKQEYDKINKGHKANDEALYCIFNWISFDEFKRSLRYFVCYS